MVTHKTIGFWGVVSAIILGIGGIIATFIVASQPSTPPDTKENNLPQKSEKLIPMPLVDTSHTKLQALPKDSLKKDTAAK